MTRFYTRRRAHGCQRALERLRQLKAECASILAAFPDLEVTRSRPIQAPTAQRRLRRITRSS
jgi:hypothetical protein